MAESATPTTFKSELVQEIKLPSAVLDADLDETRLYAACLDRGCYEIDLESSKFEKIGAHESYASGAKLKPGVLITSGYDGTILWHDLRNRRVSHRVQAHRFWSWQLALSPDGRRVASVTGQYLAGGEKYEPAPETEPSVRLYDASNGKELGAFSHHPPVLSVAFSPDSHHVAAANMMGEIRVWETASGREQARWTTPDFTSWGMIKSHHYVGGIFGLAFAPNGSEVLACGMGPMRDPMAGNGKQTWQKFAWRENPPRKTGEIADQDRGNGLMECLAFHPSGRWFAMAGRLAQGKWNVALFDAMTGALAHSLDAKMRVTRALFNRSGDRLMLCGAVGQEKKKNEKLPFGRIKIYRLDQAS
ncbi:MAG: hypothetical protein FJ404_03160 [Verrucomicrobia bacterium]|nr:hypothetical protein [Verrucomicrobiota bacterium]